MKPTCKQIHNSIVKEAYTGITKIQTQTLTHGIQLKNIKTKNDVRQWLKEREEKMFDFLTNETFLFDEIMPLQMQPRNYT